MNTKDKLKQKKKSDHFFCLLKGVNAKQTFSFRGGTYQTSVGFLYKTNIKDDYNSWIQYIINRVHSKKEPLHILVYIHGYLAENPWFASLSGYRLHKEIFDDPGHDVNLVLSLQWDSGFNYGDNRVLAHEKGRVFGYLLHQLEQELKAMGKKVRFSFLLHSMGNIVFEGLIAYYRKEIKEPLWNQVFLCAADLPTDVLNQEARFLPGMAQDIHVLFHREDKTLRVANAMMPFPRLGIHGRQDGKEFPNVHSLDTTAIAEDDTAVGSRFSHHRYFYGSKNVVGYINRFLAKKLI